jgi:hypothetical protein
MKALLAKILGIRYREPSKILLIDDLHINRKNFFELYKYASMNRIPISVIKPPRDLLFISGTWKDRAELLEPHVNTLKDLPEEKLLDYHWEGIPLYDIYIHELFSYLLAQPDWHDKALDKKDQEAIFRLVMEKNREDLLYNMAAAIWWLEWWRKQMAFILCHSHAVIFSGSHIYQRAFIKSVEREHVKTVLGETFFTGTNFYFEERLSPLPNSSFLGARFIKHNQSFDPCLVNVCLQQVAGQQNLNVQQPPSTKKRLFEPGTKTIALIGQVSNDYSIICSRNKHLSSIGFYKELLASILTETDYRVIVKTHPWEHKKTNLRRPLTFELLNGFLKSFRDGKYVDRVKIVDSHNLYDIFQESDIVATLCSQAALEAAYHGFKTAVFGSPFYGRLGFTNDYENIEPFIRDVNADPPLAGLLTLAEYDRYQQFICFCIIHGLVSPLNFEPLDDILIASNTRTHATMSMKDLGRQGMKTWAKRLGGAKAKRFMPKRMIHLAEYLMHGRIITQK